MIIKVKMFAAARLAAEAESVSLTLDGPVTVHELREALAKEYPVLVPLLQQSMIAVDEQYASDSTLVTAAEDIAMIPPVSGG